MRNQNLFPYEKRYIYIITQDRFKNIPGAPLAYWASNEVFNKTFISLMKLGEIVMPRQGLATLDNDRFLRLWHEIELIELVSIGSIKYEKRKPVIKGGSHITRAELSENGMEIKIML